MYVECILFKWYVIIYISIYYLVYIMVNLVNCYCVEYYIIKVLYSVLVYVYVMYIYYYWFSFELCGFF